MILQSQHARQGNAKPQSVQTEHFGVIALVSYSLKLTKTKFGQDTLIDEVAVWFTEPETRFSKTWNVGKYSLRDADWIVLSRHYTKSGALKAMTRYLNTVEK
jgi:hypothetical protein